MQAEQQPIVQRAFQGTDWSLWNNYTNNWTLLLGSLPDQYRYEFPFSLGEKLLDLKEYVKCCAERFLEDCDKMIACLDSDEILNNLREGLSDWKWHSYQYINFTVDIEPGHHDLAHVKIRCWAKNPWNPCTIVESFNYRREYMTDMTLIRSDITSWTQKVRKECVTVKQACQYLLKEIDNAPLLPRMVG